MTDPNKTLIAALLDRSGSMETSKQATEDGWRELIHEQRQLPGQCQVTLAQFDTVYEVVYAADPYRRRPGVHVEPRGRTALLDAVLQVHHRDRRAAVGATRGPATRPRDLPDHDRRYGERQPGMELGRRAEADHSTTAPVELEVHLHRGEHGRHQGGRADGLRRRSTRSPTTTPTTPPRSG